MKSIQLKQIKKSFVLQHGQSDCGVACLLSIIKFHKGKEITLERLRELSGTSKQGTTLLGLLQASQKLGFESEGLEATSIENLKELNEPSILHVILDDKYRHYFVYYGVVDNKFIIGDPAKGIIIYDELELEKVWVGKTLLKLVNTKELEKNISSKKDKKKWIFDFIKDDLNILVVALTIGVVNSILLLSTAVFSQKLIDNILPSGSIQRLILSLVLLFILLMAKSGLSYLRGYFLIHQSREFNNRIIQKFYSKLLKLPKSFFDNRKIGELIARMNDTRRIQSTISVLFGSLLIDLLVMSVSIIFISLYSWILGLMCVAFIPLYLLLAYRHNNSIIMTQKNVMSSYALAEGNYVDTMNGISTIKAHGQESFFEKFNQKIYSAFQTQLFNLNKINIKLSLISDVMGVIFILSIFSVTSLYVLNKTLLVGELVAIASMSRSIIPALGRLVATNIQIQEVRVVFDRMFEFTDIEPEFENSDKESHQLKWESLELNNITFRFIGRSQLLTDVSLTVNRGEIITILGESGCGKSTLLQVLQRFYEKENGEIKVNGLPFKDLTVPAWRSIIGVVPQEIKIFNGNLLYNICLSEVKEDLQKGIELCSNLGFTDFFEKLPQGLGTLVGEEGVNLSGGQKQLVAIARVLFKRPQLLLLDEVTSAMDNNTENFVLKLLEKLKNNLGIVMVTHRIKIAKNSDRIYILENGAIKLAGTANELMKTNNFFSNSYKELIA